MAFFSTLFPWLFKPSDDEAPIDISVEHDSLLLMSQDGEMIDILEDEAHDSEVQK